MKALVFDSKVVQIEAQEFDVHENLVWVDIRGITPAPEVGWSYDGTVFTAPPTLPIKPVLTPRQQIIRKLRADPVFKAQVIDSFEARGITNRTQILDALETKFADTRI